MKKSWFVGLLTYCEEEINKRPDISWLTTRLYADPIEAVRIASAVEGAKVVRVTIEDTVFESPEWKHADEARRSSPNRPKSGEGERASDSLGTRSSGGSGNPRVPSETHGTPEEREDSNSLCTSLAKSK